MALNIDLNAFKNVAERRQRHREEKNLQQQQHNAAHQVAPYNLAVAVKNHVCSHMRNKCECVRACVCWAWAHKIVIEWKARESNEN